jgi:uncharacterized membrane protein YfcA
MVPLLTGFGRMTQHEAVGTSSAAVAGTGLAGLISFGSVGSVDFVAAAALASTAVLTSALGARFTASFSHVQLQRAFGCFQLVVGPLVPLKGIITNRNKADGSSPDSEASSSPSPSPPPPTSPRTIELMMLSVTGLAAGFASGMFGIGGGLILTPALCLLTEMPHACVLGTTLASMVLPSLSSAYTHRSMGNVVSTAVLPLVAGSAIGAASGGQLAVRLPEEPLQWAFAVFCSGSGAHKLWSLRLLGKGVHK